MPRRIPAEPDPRRVVADQLRADLERIPTESPTCRAAYDALAGQIRYAIARLETDDPVEQDRIREGLVRRRFGSLPNSTGS